ncbi:MAG: hypothetical protein L6V93_07345 [Clostridiales bacterium]|nr:MAG: hypothetical protein L6V93_07345 [Clostridiales bacterium]
MNLKIEDKELFDKYINNEYENCEAVFGNLFIWRNISNTRFALCDGALCVVYTKSNGKLASCYPFGEFDTKTVIEKLKEYFCIKKGRGLLWKASPMRRVKKIKKIHTVMRLKFCPTEAFFDYVYTSDSLINLSGKTSFKTKSHKQIFLSLYEKF